MSPAKIPGHSFAGFPIKVIVSGIDSGQRALLKRFFGQSLNGALVASHTFVIPAGLTTETLERYHEVARQTIEKGVDRLCVQSVRFSLVERALAVLREDKRDG